MKKILGLDLGTNSIGWAVVNADEKTRDDGSRFLKPNGILIANENKLLAQINDIKERTIEFSINSSDVRFTGSKRLPLFIKLILKTCY